MTADSILTPGPPGPNRSGWVPSAVTAAARDGDVEAIRRWLASGGNPNQYDSQGWTPLLAAAVRGRSKVVDLLLNGEYRRADPEMGHRVSGALPIHFGGQSSDVDTARLLIQNRPDHLDLVWDLNGHTLLLQAVFFSHFELTRYALELRANTAATTVRGLGAIELALQFQNQALADLIRPYDSPPEAKAAYYQALLKSIAPVIPPEQARDQERSDRLIQTIGDGLLRPDPNAAAEVMDAITRLVSGEGADVNRLGGPLQQPPLVATVTGGNGSPNAAALREKIARFLLANGADPLLRERHPMAVNAIIRACVFNHLSILQMMAARISPEQLTAALNEQPPVNGLTALHDTVLRASTAEPDRIDGYLAQIRWCVARGARSDIEDFSGQTQRAVAEGIPDPSRRAVVLEALDPRRTGTA